jgi:hypothetical protein
MPIAVYVSDAGPGEYEWLDVEQVVLGSTSCRQKMGISTVDNAKMIEKWYRGFHGKRLFCISLKSKHNLPPILDLNPDVCAAIKEYVRANLGTMSVE